MKKEYEPPVHAEDEELEREIAKLLSDEPRKNGVIGPFSAFGRLGPTVPVSDNDGPLPSGGLLHSTTRLATINELGLFEVRRSATLEGVSGPKERGDGTRTSAPNELSPPHAQGGHASVPQWMEQLNEEYAWIEKEAAIYRLRYGDFIQPDKFRTQLNNRKVLTASGKLVGAGTAWLDDPWRRQHEKIVLRPSENRVTKDNCLNEWSGFAVEPEKGDVRWFLWLLIRLVPDRSARKFIVAWVAHFLQNPAVRNLVALVFWSHQQGVGKNLLFECLVSIVGCRHATVIGQEQLHGTFNGWVKNKLFVIGDEVVGSDKRQEGDKLKLMITASTVHINEKYQPVVEMPNLMNLIFLSNHPDAMFMVDADRRYYVNEITSPRLTTAEATEFASRRDNGGLAALLYWFLHLDVSGFDPKAPAPMTAAKQQMIEDSRSDLESWAVDLLASDLTLRIGREVVTAHELANRYSAETGRSSVPSSKTVVGVFKKLGAYARPTQIRVAGGKKLRVLALGRPDFWKSQSEASWAGEYAKALR